MNVLVAGSEGSLMQWTIDHLLEAGHDVLGVDNQSRYEDYDLTRVVDRDRYEYVRADLTDPDVAVELTEDVDGIINAAALIYGVKGFHEYPADILSNDLTIHRNLLEGAVENDVPRVVYISSSMVYEQDETPHREDDVWDSLVPSTDYGLSKVVGERYSRAFADQYDVTYTIWRPFNIITPYERGEDEPGMSHVFADFIRKILIEEQNPMEIFGDGEQVRCFTWIDEVAEAIATQSFVDETKNEAYNLANPEPVTMKELARRIHRAGVERGLLEDEPLEFEHVPIYDDDVKERVPVVEKAAEDFGWQPEVKLEDSLERCIDEVDELYLD
ncbi:NAD-dependent epimerase/dehydratase family protein [Halopiger goleimassiliensis]|uniref:NAD-dependent epimerase/dehydratase family protein n=1 Tax=Halopiger goleimassiliensis TaxID=1293048 RepID=UPI000677BE75|nr:NAD-dependent epimerase/dehydratase family protein [Halopiger goleimassiliensis]